MNEDVGSSTDSDEDLGVDGGLATVNAQTHSTVTRPSHTAVFAPNRVLPRCINFVVEQNLVGIDALSFGRYSLAACEHERRTTEPTVTSSAKRK